MGWWSCDIMGGDTPLDIECVIYQALDLDMESPLPKDIDLEPMLKKVKDDDEYWLGEGSDIFYQVLGVLMMKYGCNIPDHLKNQMFDAANNDKWAKEEEERQNVMDGFIQALEAYNGTPIIIKSKGLFQVMAEKMFDPPPLEPEETDLDEDDLMFIQDALNNYFLEAINSLEQKDKLGDLELKHMEDRRDKSKKLIEKIDKILSK